MKMAKAKKAPSPAAEAKKQKREEAKYEAEKLQKIRDAAFAKGQRMAARQLAKQQGFAAGMKAEQQKSTKRGK